MGGEIEFLSIKVPGGLLTEYLQRIRIGDTVLMRRKPTGTLVNDALLPGKRLFLFASGTGIVPFAGLIRDPESYEKFERIFLCHICREVAELSYGLEMVAITEVDPLVGDLARRQLTHYPPATREAYRNKGRPTDLMRSGRIFDDLKVSPISHGEDRGMICGSMNMFRDTKAVLESFGLEEGSNSRPATFVVEKAFAD